MMAGGNGHKFRYVKLHLNTAKSLFFSFFFFKLCVWSDSGTGCSGRLWRVCVGGDARNPTASPGQPAGADPAN